MRAVARQRADGTTGWDWYCRETRTRLPDPIPDPAGFIRAVAAARQPAPRWQSGSIGEALAQWRRSPQFKALAAATRANRDRYTAPLDKLADRPLTSLRRAEVLAMRDEMAESAGPAAANALAQSVSAFLAWCLDRTMVEHNCAAKITGLAGGHFLTWTEAEAKAAMDGMPEPLRRMVVLAYYLGARRGDLTNLTWSAYDAEAGTISLQPEKTAKRREARQMPPLRLPVHPELQAELDAWKAENKDNAKPVLTILCTTLRRKWRREYASWQIAEWVRKLGLREHLSLHGFRKLAAVRLAEAGATTSEIAAALGWESLSYVELYTRAASQERLARAAVVRLIRPAAPAESQTESQTGTNRKK